MTKLTITRGDGAGVLRGALTMGRLEALSTIAAVNNLMAIDRRVRIAQAARANA